MKKFEYSKGTAFLKDSFIPFSEANVSIAGSSFLYGLTIYTVLAVNFDVSNKKRTIFRLEDHFNRLISSAKIMDFQEFIKEWDYNRFEKMIMDLVEKNNINENILIRVSVFVDALIAGTKIRGLPNSLCAYIYPLGEILPRSGINVCVSSFRRNPDNCIPPRAKINGGYVNVALMKNEALMNGYDDALALDEQGFVTEGTVANFFIKKDDVIITPPVNSAILEGITRNSLIQMIRDMGIEVVERPISRSELYTPEEAFICGTSARITPVLSIDKRIIGNGKPSSFTTLLSRKYDEVLKGKVREYKDWILTF